MKKSIAWLLALLAVLLACPASAEEAVDTAGAVTQEMCRAAYWKEADPQDPAALLLTSEEIRQYNRVAVQSPGAYMFDLAALAQEDYGITPESRAERAKDADVPLRPLYVEGSRINNRAYFAPIKTAIQETGYPDGVRRSEMAVAVRYTALLAAPTLDVITTSAGSPHNRYQNSALTVNEPFVIRQTAVVNGVQFYFGYTTNMSGWVRAEDLALFGSYERWLDEAGNFAEEAFRQDYEAWKAAWDFDLDDRDFLVVNQDKLLLETVRGDADVSGVKLTLSTALRLVPTEEKPSQVGGRGTWHNYVAYLPTRDENGQCVEKMVLIPQHCNVSVGYLPYTQGNLLDVAFACLGNRYGWSGMLDAYDCSLYIRTIYRCFGFEMPRNTTCQQNVGENAALQTVKLSGRTNAQKAQYIAALPVGSVLYLNGHTMLYVGTVNGESYVISALGSVIEPEGELEAQSEYSIVLNTLSCRRTNGKTWLHELTTALVPNQPEKGA